MGSKLGSHAVSPTMATLPPLQALSWVPGHVLRMPYGVEREDSFCILPVGNASEWTLLHQIEDS